MSQQLYLLCPTCGRQSQKRGVRRDTQQWFCPVCKHFYSHKTRIPAAQMVADEFGPRLPWPDDYFSQRLVAKSPIVGCAENDPGRQRRIAPAHRMDEYNSTNQHSEAGNIRPDNRRSILEPWRKPLKPPFNQSSS